MQCSKILGQKCKNDTCQPRSLSKHTTRENEIGKKKNGLCTKSRIINYQTMSFTKASSKREIKEKIIQYATKFRMSELELVSIARTEAYLSNNVFLTSTNIKQA